MLSSVGEKLGILEAHIAFINPSEWAEYMNITQHSDISEEAENCRGSLSYGERRLERSWIRQRTGALDWICL